MFVIISLLAAMTSAVSAKPTRHAPPKVADAKIDHTLPHGKQQWFVNEMVRTRLIDPDSAQFRYTKICLFTENNKMAFGMVNSKNRFGGYTGYRLFVVFQHLDDLFIGFPSQDADEISAADIDQMQENSASMKLIEGCPTGNRFTIDDLVR
jgi:hypothetical protein